MGGTSAAVGRHKTAYPPLSNFNRHWLSAGIAIFGLTTLAAGVLRDLSSLATVMLIGGAAWIAFISLFNVQVLSQTPDWVRARVLAVSMLVFQGAVAAGSATWGAVDAILGIRREFTDARFVVLTTYYGDVQALRALKAGATDLRVPLRGRTIIRKKSLMIAPCDSS
jgi:hypothetical protein